MWQDVMRSKPADYEAITVSDTAIGLTAAKYNHKTVKAYITCEDADLRYRIDGTDPTSSEGHALASGDALTLISLVEIQQFKAIRSGGSNAAIRVTYYETLP